MHLQGGQHGTGGDRKRLDDKGANDQYHKENGDKGIGGLHGAFHAPALLLELEDLVDNPDRNGDQQRKGQPKTDINIHQSSTLSTARNASWGISTLPTCFMRFLPSFCFCNSFFLRDTSPP